MSRKGVTFLQSFGIIGIMAITTSWDVSAWNECWCGWGDPETKTWHCRRLVPSGLMAPVSPQWSEGTCDFACKDKHGLNGNDHHFWYGYSDPKQQCIDVQQTLTKEGRIEGTYKLDVSDEDDPYWSNI